MGQEHTGADAAAAGWADPATPLAGFSRCHAGILDQVEAFAGLPALMHAATRARTVAADTLGLFERVVLAHHGDEESELFPAVLRWAQKGGEHDRVQALIQQLTAEHRHIEKQEILARDSAHLASLGMSLHMRHAPRIPGYI